MTVVLIIIGGLLLLASLAGVALGLFIATNHGTRESGLFFALWWTPAVAASAGVMMRDPVTFLIGLICFVVAGAVLYLGRGADDAKSRRGFDTPKKKARRVESDRARARAKREATSYSAYAED